MMTTRVFATTFAVVVLFIAHAPAGAHAFLDHSDPVVGSTVPPSPAVIHLWFTQRLEPAFSSVTVTARSGAIVNDGPAAIDPHNSQELDVKLKTLPTGTYKVKWRVLSVDTHATQGDFTFNVRGG